MYGYQNEKDTLAMEYAAGERKFHAEHDCGHRCPSDAWTHKQMSRALSGHKVQLPVTVLFSTDGGETWKCHSQIVSDTDRRVFADHANKTAVYCFDPETLA